VNNSKNAKLIKGFGKKLRQIRIEKHISQEYLADEAGIPVSQIGRIERGEINTTISTAYLLATKLGVTINDMFDF
jgi:transcriptional regulator with XRE-family HTH domain